MGESKRVGELLKKASFLLQKFERPRFEAELLLSFFLKRERVWLFLNEDFEVKDWENFLEIVKKRANGYPIEYILEKVSFYSKEFFIKEGVLIPRPETELLVDEGLKILKNMKNAKVAEIGVGSGIVSVMLALLKEDIKITATDISKKALRIAYENAVKFGVENKIDFLQTSFLDKVEGDFDLIISNPPYISTSFKLDKSVLNEPKEALFGGERGDEILKEIISLAVKRRVKYLVCEMGYDQKNYIKEHLLSFGIKEFGFYKDLAHLDRGFWAKICWSEK